MNTGDIVTYFGIKYKIDDVMPSHVKLVRLSNDDVMYVSVGSARYNQIFNQEPVRDFNFAFISQSQSLDYDLNFNKSSYFAELVELYSTKLDSVECLNDIAERCVDKPETLLFLACYAYARISVKFNLKRLESVCSSSKPLYKNYNKKLLKKFIELLKLESNEKNLESIYRELAELIPACESHAYIRSLCGFEWFTPLNFTIEEARELFIQLNKELS